MYRGLVYLIAALILFATHTSGMTVQDVLASITPLTYEEARTVTA